MRPLLLAAILALVLAHPALADWQRPVPGAVARAFAYGPDPFAAGWHRGVDLAAAGGSTVRAACSGRVVTARPGLVTLRCGRWRATHLPLATVSVRRGEAVRAGRKIGTLARASDHVGLHLGVRRAGQRFGYVDPLPFLGAATTSPPPIAARRIPRAGPRAPAALADPARGPVPVGVRVFAPATVRGLAPWPAWIGLAVLLLGAGGGGVRVGVRRHRARGRAPLPSAP